MDEAMDARCFGGGGIGVDIVERTNDTVYECKRWSALRGSITRDLREK
jgi:hypothetical protein